MARCLNARRSTAQTHAKIGMEFYGKRKFKLTAKPVDDLRHGYISESGAERLR